MKRKYQCKDKRTGYAEDEIVELTIDELNKLPFNSSFKLMEPVDDKKRLEDAALEQDKADLRALLQSHGLSKGRQDKVLKQACNREELESLLKGDQLVDIDELTLDFLQKLLGSSKSSKKEKKKVESKTDVDDSLKIKEVE